MRSSPRRRGARRDRRLAAAASVLTDVSWPFQGVIWATWPSRRASRPRPSRSRSPAAAHRARIEAVVVDAVVDAHGERPPEHLVEAGGRVVRVGDHRLRAPRQHPEHRAAHHVRGEMLVGAHHERRRSPASRDRGHQAGSSRVRMDHVRRGASCGARERPAARGELRHAHRSLNRVDPEAGVHRRQGQQVDARLPQRVGERALLRTGDAHGVRSAQAGDHAQQRHLGAAPRARVVCEEDPHPKGGSPEA